MAEPTILSGTGTLTLIDGLTFAISGTSGDIGDGLDGLIADDTRHLSRLTVHVDGSPVRPLGAAVLTPGSARFMGVTAPRRDYSDPPLEIERRRRVTAGGMEDELLLRWWAEEPSEVSVAVEIAADFADIFAIRGLEIGPARTPSHVSVEVGTGGMCFIDTETGLTTDVRFSSAPDVAEAGEAVWSPRLSRGDPWRLRISVLATNAESETLAGAPPGRPPSPVHVVTQPPDLARACGRGLTDLAALSLPDRLAPSRRLVAAGIPWFVALFGRDSLIAGHQARAFLPDQMTDTLAALAARQGRTSDPANDEAPGKILHEVRLTPRPWLGRGTASGARPYFGSIDSTPLFLILLGTAFRWGAPPASITRLLPTARAAMAWLRGPADPDGDGLLEYRPEGTRSLANQAWKDSANAVQHPDGTLAEGPVAMVEVQGYAYRARRELAEVLRHLGNPAEAAALEREAADLRRLILDRYWCPGVGDAPGYFAMALDGRKTAVASVSSNMGHLLWCDVPTPRQATEVARHLTGNQLFSGWGLRTLARDMGGFNPISYHVGSVWPHDTALACEGLRRYGLDDHACRLAAGLLDALGPFDDRLPELFGGHDRLDRDVPIPYPTACRPQAWAAGVPLQLATMFLGLEPHIPDGRITLRPALPPGLGTLELRGIRFPGGPLSVRTDRDRGTRVLEAPGEVLVELRNGADVSGERVSSSAEAAGHGHAC